MNRQELSTGSVRAIAEKTYPQGQQPVLQVINIKAMNQGTRFRLTLSDGINFIPGMLATQINDLAKTLNEGAYIRLCEHMVNRVQQNSKMVVICLKVEIVDNTPGIPRVGSNLDPAPGCGWPEGKGAPPPTVNPLYNSTNAGAPAHQPQVNRSYGGGGSPGGGSNPYNRRPNSAGSGRGGVVSPVGSSNPYGSNNRPPSSNFGGPSIARSNDPNNNFTPISGLNMYNNRWTLRARITVKGDIRTWSNAKGEGQLFSIELLDQSGMDIRATFFKEAVTKFYDMLQVNKVYRLSGGRIKVANQRYNKCKSNLELTFDENSEIHLDNDDGGIQSQLYDFVKVADIEQKEINATIDVLAIVKFCQAPATVISKKTGNELHKCTLTLVDDSNTEISLTIWGDKALKAPQDFPEGSFPVVAFRRARVGDFGGKSLNGGDGMEINPDLPQAQQLRQWYDTQGATATSRSLSSTGGAGKVDALTDRKSIAAIKQESLGLHNEKGDYLSFKATISFFKTDKEGGAWYPACPNADEPCKNRYKVSIMTDDKWQCDKCTRQYEAPLYRWIFSGTIEDDTGNTWVSFFNETAELLMDGAKANDVQAQTQGGGEEYAAYFDKARWGEWIFRCRVKNEMVNGESRVKTSVQSITPVDYVKDAKDMLAELEKFN